MNPINPTDQAAKHKIIILDSDQGRRNYLRAAVSAWGYLPYCFEKETICLDNLAALAPDLAVYGNPALEKLFRFVAALRLISRKLPLLILSSSPVVKDYAHTNELAPVWLLAENVNPAEIKKSIHEHIDCACVSQTASDCPLIIGNCPEIIRIKKLMPELSRSRETVLIMGEAGTGKELFAKAIYFGSDRKDEPFVKVDAAAIFMASNKNALKDENASIFLGDHFSGCLSAGSGTVFLDGIERLPADFQGSLLQIIEERDSNGLESVPEHPAALRIIAAADAQLESKVAEGAFRKDLFYRLNVLSVTIPPLRDRAEDIPLLADFFADKFCLEFGRSFFEIPSRVKSVLCGYHWPGNVAELEDTIRGMVASGDGDKIIKKLGRHSQADKRRGMTDFLEDVTRADLIDLKKYTNDNKKVSMKDISRMYKTRSEGKLIRKALEFNGWNRRKTAAMLSISYKSLLNKIKAYEMEKKQS